MTQWPKYRVWLKGEDEPFDVQTNAFDVLGLEMAMSFDFLLHNAHNALVRQEFAVPRNFRAFLEVLAAPIESADDDDEVGPLDPTRPDQSGG